MQPRSNDHTVLILLAALFLFISPLTAWWSSLALPWYSIFFVWGAVVLLIAVNQRWQNPDDH
jgi:hypothetical protein